jgi:hypothetical protein
LVRVVVLGGIPCRRAPNRSSWGLACSDPTPRYRNHGRARDPPRQPATPCSPGYLPTPYSRESEIKSINEGGLIIRPNQCADLHQSRVEGSLVAHSLLSCHPRSSRRCEDDELWGESLLLVFLSTQHEVRRYRFSPLERRWKSGKESDALH